MKVKLNLMDSLLLIAILLTSVPAFTDEYTAFSTISSIEYDANGELLYLKNADASSWGVANCTTADYVVIQPSVAGKEELLSLVLAAKMSGSTVRFYGSCNAAHPRQFNTHWVHMK